jgi:very-short-patch-repair endonuclease
MSKKRYNKNSIKKMKDKLKGAQSSSPRNRSNRPMTYLEQIIADMLDGLSIEYEREKAIPFQNKWRYFDFHLIEHGILIEVDGTYWHDTQGKPSYVILMAKKNDYQKNWLAKKEGYKLIRIKEKQLKEEYDTVVENISSAVGKECR